MILKNNIKHINETKLKVFFIMQTVIKFSNISFTKTKVILKKV